MSKLNNLPSYLNVHCCSLYKHFILSGLISFFSPPLPHTPFIPLRPL